MSAMETNQASNSFNPPTKNSPAILFISNDDLHPCIYSGSVDDSAEKHVWRLENNEKISKIACGNEHVLILTGTGSVYSFGNSEFGQLGHADRISHSSPKRIELFDIFASGNIVTNITCGNRHSIALTAEGDVYTWGWNESGQLGLDLPIGEDIFATKPKMVKSLASKMVVQIKAGHSHSIVLTNTGEIYAFGSNSCGQLGLGIAKGLSQSKPCLIELFTGFPAALIEAGGFHSFALSISGSVFGFGKNSSGQLGIGDGTGDKYQPTQVTSLRSLGVRYVSAGEEHTTFLTQDGGVFTCGNGVLGSLGHNSSSNEILPRKILEFGSVVYQISCGNYHTLCLTKDRLYSFGRLGHIVVGNHPNSPLHITSLRQPVESIFAGGDKSYILLTSSTHKHSTNTLNKSEIPSSSFDYREYSQSTQVLNITDEVITHLCSASEPVDQFVLTLTELIFSSPSIWNSSFLLPDNQHIPSTYYNMGVSLEQADAVLSKLQSVKSRVLSELINHMILKDLLPKLPHQLKHVEILRIYVLLPLLPVFHNGLNSLLPILFAERLQSLERQVSQVVFGWMYNSPINQLQRLVSVYKKAIITIIESSQSQSSKDKSLKICLKFLSELHSMNRNTLRLSHHTFSIPPLPSKVDIRDDYVKWLRYKGTSRALFLCDYPFIFDAQAKTILLQTDQYVQMQIAMTMAEGQVIPALFTFGPEVAQQVKFLTLHVSRNRLVPDTLAYLQNLTTADLKKPLRIKFVGEEAEDAGGVKKEFFLLLIREILNPQYALYKKLLNEKVDLQDLIEMNPTVARSLEQLMEYNGADIEDVFLLHFEISEDIFGTVKTTELKPGGSKIPVNHENKAEFVELYIAHIFNTSVQLPFEAFKDGFERVCGGTVLPLFYAQELQAMVTGNEDYDWGELENGTTYKGGYHANDLTIKLFWEVFYELSLDEKRQFLLFLTGSDRVPISGMKSLQISIQPTTDNNHLPSAHTCYNLLDFPRLTSAKDIATKLKYAIQHNQGFGFI